MRYSSVVLWLGLCVLPASAFGQTIFKCTGVGGRTIYQQQPCAETAASSEEIAVKATRPSSADAPAGIDATTSMMRGVEITQVDYDVSNCISGASNRVFGPTQRRVAVLEQEKAQLLRAARQANNNLAGASWEAGLRSQIAGIDSAIATERSGADAVFAQERQRCEDEGQRSRERIRQAHAAADAAATK